MAPVRARRHTRRVEDPFWSSISHVADLLTIVASLVVLAGVVVAVINHPRLRVTPTYETATKSGKVTVLHHGGIDPARLVKVSVQAQTGGVPMVGDGLESNSFLLDEQMTVQAFDSRNGYSPPPPLPFQKDAWIVFDPPAEVFLVVSWQRPLLSWTRTTRAFRWTAEDQKAGRAPQRIPRRAVRRTLRGAKIPV